MVTKQNPAKRTRNITRENTGDTFEYRLGARRITGRASVERIEALAIPPAWTDVEISRSATAKVQAKGVDAAGRTQAIYHPSFVKRQDQRKFARMVRFGRALPKLRARVDRDLRSRSLGRDRVAGCVIHLIDEQLFRVGNAEYASRHGSFGITTLQRKHLDVSPTIVEFNFVGKSGKEQKRRVRDPRAARVIAQLLELPGDEVFRFVEAGQSADEDADPNPHPLHSRHVNAYVRRHLGREFSAKDFRTWGGTVAVVGAIFAVDPAELRTALTTEHGRASVLRDAVRIAAERLGNTEAVTKGSYVDPRVLDLVSHPRVIERVRRKRFRERLHFSIDEQRTLAVCSRR
ncbi:DNA topoisomerase IB [Leucobacter denitrificans]|uniref:DNA topoisomerase n=1 Tax=Leucobacter denitrificans TaxID=683042 RepID=A0A7G9S689_9MICO|nr:DNA topoisomerase IB [Leucobacter denitrificans]QNN63364.1 DNA topoisomerase IB [Leucobacter denitrificans]